MKRWRTWLINKEPVRAAPAGTPLSSVTFAPSVVQPCRAQWLSVGDQPQAWHKCIDHNGAHTHDHACHCGATCPVLGLNPPSAEGTPTA